MILMLLFLKMPERTIHTTTKKKTHTENTHPKIAKPKSIILLGQLTAGWNLAHFIHYSLSKWLPYWEPTTKDQMKH